MKKIHNEMVLCSDMVAIAKTQEKFLSGICGEVSYVQINKWKKSEEVSKGIADTTIYVVNGR